MLLKRGIHFYLVLGLFAVYLFNGLIAIPRNSVTYDEMDHWSYGKRILMRNKDIMLNLVDFYFPVFSSKFEICILKKMF